MKALDINVNSQPFMRWRDRFLSCAKAIYKAQVETGEIKGYFVPKLFIKHRLKQVKSKDITATNFFFIHHKIPVLFILEKVQALSWPEYSVYI